MRPMPILWRSKNSILINNILKKKKYLSKNNNILLFITLIITNIRALKLKENGLCPEDHNKHSLK